MPRSRRTLSKGLCEPLCMMPPAALPLPGATTRLQAGPRNPARGWRGRHRSPLSSCGKPWSAAATSWATAPPDRPARPSRWPAPSASVRRDAVRRLVTGGGGAASAAAARVGAGSADVHRAGARCLGRLGLVSSEGRRCPRCPRADGTLDRSQAPTPVELTVGEDVSDDDSGGGADTDAGQSSST